MRLGGKVCHVRFYPFLGQPFPKRLYTRVEKKGLHSDSDFRQSMNNHSNASLEREKELHSRWKIKCAQ